MNPNGAPARPNSCRALLMAPALVTLAALVSGCGLLPRSAEKADPDPITLDDETTLPVRNADTPTTNGIANAVVKPFDLDQTVWFGGFKMTLTKGSVEASDKTLTIEGEAENEGEEQSSVSGDARLEQGGVSVAEGRMRSQSSVLAGSRNAMTIAFDDIPAVFDPAKAVVVLGDAKHQQVRVPLRKQQQQPAMTGEPVIQTKPGPLRAGTAQVDTKELSVRYDDPSHHRQAPSDKAYLVLDGSVRFDGVSTNFQGQNFTIKPPNGSSQAANNLNALPHDGSSEDIYAVFEIPTPVGGDYTLTIKGHYGSNNLKMHPDIDVSADFKVTLKADEPGAGSATSTTKVGS